MGSWYDPPKQKMVSYYRVKLMQLYGIPISVYSFNRMKKHGP